MADTEVLAEIKLPPAGNSNKALADYYSLQVPPSGAYLDLIIYKILPAKIS